MRTPHTARFLYVVWIACVCALYVLHFVHPLADFPNNSPWISDYSKYTDEGWYSNAAVRHILLGRWYVPGDFNPAAALPVWPFLLAVLFHFSGVSLAAARIFGLVILGLNLLLAYRLVRTQSSRWAALVAVTLLASSPFLYAFSRLALLEPLLIWFLLLSWLLALRLHRAGPAGQKGIATGIGLLLCLMVLTKTTAIFIIPSTLFLIARASGSRWQSSVRHLLITLFAGAVPWCAWYFLVVQPHYQRDYSYFFEANRWPPPTTFTGRLAAFWYALHGTLWISPTLCITAAFLLLLASLSFARKSSTPSGTNTCLHLRRHPLIVASGLAAGGYIFFAGWNNNPQPRYYQAVLYPVVFVVALTASSLSRAHRPRQLKTGAAAAIMMLACVSATGAWRIAAYVRHPEFTWLHAAESLTRYIDRHPGPHRLLLSVSGDDIFFITGLPAICDDYGSWDLDERIRIYEPGWYAAWNDLDDGTLADLHTRYSLWRVAAFSAFDDPDRNLLILYRLNPLPESGRAEIAVSQQASTAITHFHPADEPQQ